MPIFFYLKNKFYGIIKKFSGKPIQKTIRRIAINNAIKNKKIILKFSPEIVQIDITGYCNLKCRMCPQSTDNALEKGVMSFDLYKKIIDKAKNAGVLSVILTLSGEPLLHKNIVDMIRYAKEKKLYISFSTNATLLNKKMSSDIIKSGLDEIMFSIDTVNKNDYEKYRQGAVFEEVITNIEDFFKIRRDLKSSKPFVFLQNLKPVDSNIPKLKLDENYIKMFSKYSNTWLMPKYYSQMSGVMDNKTEINYYENQANNKKKKYSPCRNIYQRFVVSWDGKVLSCCIDFPRSQIMGDINQNTLMEIWNNERFIHLRKDILDKKYIKYPRCASCSDLWV